jgi:hypothetical protein
MDVDVKVGYDKVLKYRDYLETCSNKIIPVWHKSLGINEFKKMVKNYNYVSIPCVGNKEIPLEQIPYFVKHAHKNNTKIHGLGMTQKKILDTVPFDSVDSSSWFKTPRFGRYKNKRLDTTYIRENSDKLFILEYMDFIKFHNKYYKKWKFYHND